MLKMMPSLDYVMLYLLYLLYEKYCNNALENEQRMDIVARYLERRKLSFSDLPRRTFTGRITHLTEDFGIFENFIYFPCGESQWFQELKVGDEVQVTAFCDSHFENCQFETLELKHDDDLVEKITSSVNICCIEGFDSDRGFCHLKDGQQIHTEVIDSQYPLMPGDWLRVMGNSSLDTSSSLTAEPLRTITCTTMIAETVRKGYVTKNKAFVPFEILQDLEDGITIGSRVKMICFESMTHPRCNWRAVRVEKSDDSEDVEADSSNALTKNSLSDSGACVAPSEIVFAKCPIGSEQSQYFTVTCTTETVLLNVFLVSVTMPYTLFIEEKLITADTFPKTLTNGHPLMVKVVLRALDIGRNETFCRFEFEKGSVLNKISSQVFCPDELLMDSNNILNSANAGPNTNISHMKQTAKNASWIVPGIKPIYSTKSGTPSKLPLFPAPQKIYSAMENGRDMTIVCPEILSDLNGRNYASKFHALLYIEEVQAEMEMLVYNMSGVQLRPENEFLYMDVPGLSEGRPSLLVGDRIIVTETHDVTGSSPRHEAFIHRVTANTIFLRFNEGFHARYDGYAVDVQFVPNRNSFRKAHLAAQYSSTSFPTWLLFPQWLDEKRPIFVPNQKKLEVQQRKASRAAFSYGHQVNIPFLTPVFPILHGGSQNTIAKYTHSIARNVPNLSKSQSKLTKDLRNQDSFFINQKLNERQKLAVRRILAAECRPMPYILFGPPGTGKTITVVESILQVFVNITDSRILACTPSNSAADLIVERLKDSGVVGLVDVIRFNAANRNVSSIPESILSFCCNDLDEVETISRYRIIVSTCTTAGNFYPLELQPGHFTHVFIDEAAQATEPETMIAVGLTAGSPEAVTILAGDPKQLGPVLRSHVAETYGLGESLLGRLSERKIYQRDESAFGSVGNYNPKVMTKLVVNYRSHACLLAMPSKIFYDDELLPEGDKALTELFIGWEHLPNPNFPLIFFGVRGKDKRENDSPSWFNPGEVVQIVKYVKLILDAKIVKPVDIGVITPYKKQVEKIRQFAASCDVERIKVGSVEEFQGQERQVILLSTVRSDESKVESDVYHNLGFLSNPRRFNVATTRAHSLLVIVGNPFVLVQDPYWKSIIQYALLNNCYKGCDPPEKHLRDSDRFSVLLQQSNLTSPEKRENSELSGKHAVETIELIDSVQSTLPSHSNEDQNGPHYVGVEEIDHTKSPAEASISICNIDADDEGSPVASEESTVSINLVMSHSDDDTLSLKPDTSLDLRHNHAQSKDAGRYPTSSRNNASDEKLSSIATNKLDNSNENLQPEKKKEMPILPEPPNPHERRVRFAKASTSNSDNVSETYNQCSEYYYSKMFSDPHEEAGNLSSAQDKKVDSDGVPKKDEKSSEGVEMLHLELRDESFGADSDSSEAKLKSVPFVSGIRENPSELKIMNPDIAETISSVASMSTEEFMLLQSSPKLPLSAESSIIDMEKVDSRCASGINTENDFLPDTTADESFLGEDFLQRNPVPLNESSTQIIVTDSSKCDDLFQVPGIDQAVSPESASVTVLTQVVRHENAKLNRLGGSQKWRGLDKTVEDKVANSSVDFSSNSPPAMGLSEFIVKPPDNFEKMESSPSLTPTSFSSVTENTSATSFTNSSANCFSSASWLEDSENTESESHQQVTNLMVRVPDAPPTGTMTPLSENSSMIPDLHRNGRKKKSSNDRQDTLNADIDMVSAGYFSDNLIDITSAAHITANSNENVNWDTAPITSRSDSVVDSIRSSSRIYVSGDVDLGSFLVSENSAESESYPDFINSESGQSSRINHQFTEPYLRSGKNFESVNMMQSNSRTLDSEVIVNSFPGHYSSDTAGRLDQVTPSAEVSGVMGDPEVNSSAESVEDLNKTMNKNCNKESSILMQ